MPKCLASVSYISSLHSFTMNTSASSSSTWKTKVDPILRCDQLKLQLAKVRTAKFLLHHPAPKVDPILRCDLQLAKVRTAKFP